MLRQRQTLKLLQKISPQQIQFIKLLQVPTASLETRIKEELEINPALEDEKMKLSSEEEERPADEYKADSDTSEDKDDYDSGEDDFSINDYLEGESYKTKLPTGGDDEEEYETPMVADKSLFDSLSEQLGMLSLDEDEQIIASHLIGSIDDDGYLRRAIPAVINDMAFRHNLKAEPEQVEALLERIQKFDPAGVGARDLKECLLLQIKRKKGGAEVEHARDILENHFEEFSKKHFDRLRSACSLSEDELKNAYELITKLNPKPGESKSSAANHQIIIPDFSLVVEDGEIDIKLNGRNAPDLKVSRNYLKMYEEYAAEQKRKKDPKTKETLTFVKNKIESAQWFIDAIKQRQYTLLNTMYAIAEKQTAFFLSGGDEKKLKPMILKDIAEEIGMDISTISRVANSKFVQTEWTIYPLKYFFTEGITTEDGTEVSNREVKTILGELVAGEEKKKPLSDDKLSELLKKEGYNIARRTVAKYREQLGIPVARLRKEI